MALDPLEKSDIVQLQEDITMGLLSWDALDRINVVSMRKLRMAEMVSAETIYASPRNGRAGCGVLVEMPTIEVEHMAAPGPADFFVVSCAILEEPNLNMEPTQGTLMDAESVGRLVRRFLHQWFLAGKGELYPERRALVPADEWPGLVAYRASVRIQLAGDSWQRLTCPSATENALTVTLTNDAATPDAEIYYTRDNSLPGPGNSAAVKYVAPFAVPAGTVVRWAAWKVGWLPSSVDRATIN